MTKDPRLSAVIDELSIAKWAWVLVDEQLRLVHVSDEQKKFIGEWDDEILGVGRNVIEAMTQDVWMQIVPPESSIKILSDLAPFLFWFGEREEILEATPEAFRPFLESMQPHRPPAVRAGTYEYLERDHPGFTSVYYIHPLHDADGSIFGFIGNFLPSISQTVLIPLARGDEAMHSRMARLAEPALRSAAVLFVDLQSSGTLSNKLSSTTYFRLIRSMTTEVDALVAASGGVVGGHAGDGLTAFFVTDDLGSDSAAAAAALNCARLVPQVGRRIAEELAEEMAAVRPEEYLINVGLHWGGRLYMGQLVTGGRLEVTAFGDEMIECARIQQTARNGQVLVSKNLIERLDNDAASAADLDHGAIVYRGLREVPTATEKAVRDAGSVLVMEL